MAWGEAHTAGTIPVRFARVVDRQPDAIAIAGAGEPIGYEELDELAAAYAARIPDGAALPPLTGGVAALLFDHGPAVIVAALAALRRGYCVVTLDPTEPAARHALVRDVVVPSVLLTDAGHVAAAEEAGFDATSAVLLGADPGLVSAPADVAPDPDAIAFLIATSGSTGELKLVLQPHRNILHNVLRYTNGLGIEPEDRIAWLASLSGGQGLATAWTALLSGATLCPFAIAEWGVTDLREWLAEHRVSVLDTVPSVLRALALRDQRIDGLRLVRLASAAGLGSEAGLGSDHAAFRRVFSGECRLATVLGSAEAGILAQAIIPPDFAAGERLPVGFEADGMALSLEDADGAPVPDGEPGEIVVTSRYLSPGYFEDDALTAARYETVDGARRFHTGDLGVRLPDGMLTVVGRRRSAPPRELFDGLPED